MNRAALSVAITMILVLTGCGSGNKSSTPQGTSLTVTGNVTYSGADSGSLIISIDTRTNPVCPQDTPVLYKMVPTVTPASFPYPYVFTNLAADTYYVYAFFDVNGDAGLPPCPKADDICGRVGPEVVDDATPTATVDVPLDIVGCQQ